MENWFIKSKKADVGIIARQFGISQVLAQLIVNRNIKSNKELEEYINPSLKNLYKPELLKDADKACNILINKIKEKKSIRIIGDYDVDGVMSTYILQKALARCGAIVDYEIPDRIKDGYGINHSIIEAAKKDNIDTIITCDNGIAACDEIQAAKDMGITVIITDHHDVPFQIEGEDKKFIIPNADAIVNPKQEVCSYPFPSICGAVVAYKLVQLLYRKYDIDISECDNFLEFAAIATVCDVMDVIDENRIIVKHGIKALEQSNNIGINALLEVTGLKGKQLSVYHLGFVLGPCINASGRLESAKLGLKMLLSSKEEEAKILAEQLKELNDQRKELTVKGLDDAIQLIDQTNMTKDKVLVVYLPDCHESLAGIIAGRIRETFNKPAIVLTNCEEGVKGSGRSIEQYHMFDELSKCKDILSRFGGHPMAAGLSMDNADKIEELRSRLNQQTVLTDDDFIAKVTADMVLPLQQVTLSLIREINILEPFGKGNTKPLFAVKDVKLHKAVILGKNSNVLKLTVSHLSQTGTYCAMLFSNIEKFETYITNKYSYEELEKLYHEKDNSIHLDIMYYPSINEYNGYENIQIIIQNYR